MTPLNYSGGRPDGSKAISRDGDLVSSHFFGQSSFASYALTTKNNIVVIDKNIPFEVAAPLACSGQTGIGAVLNSVGIAPKDTIMITGAGSVGLYAVMAAKMMGCENIIVSDPLQSRRNLAMEIGATHAIDPRNEDVTKRVREICPRGVDAVIEATGIPAVLDQSYEWIGFGGKVAIVGIPHKMDASHPGTTMQTLGMGTSIIGVLEGDSHPQTFIPEILKAYNSGQMPLEKIVMTYDFKDINIAFKDQHEGLCAKPVLLFND
jgi:aryl-alcohol dehydrogenase